MKRFNPSSHQPERALQAWVILVGAATNRQILTYQLLSEKMFGKPAAGVLDDILGHIAFYCMDHNLPPLTAIVVNKETGNPGADIPLEPIRYGEARESVYKFGIEWFDVYPPTVEELAESFAKHTKA
ncbi:MAG: hypothetical protein BWY56_01713 [Acidobacteria bacterium ADurb.Bin340]|nr:MAG: hypothetical protein BWY56_01713 [Acidobacteria bacterium ADurb.Bin340]